MQDPAMFNQMAPQFPEHEQLKCPRRDSANTKFCYYNNYNLSQPRHFCKNCRRYWTKGGALRNFPVGGAIRKYRNRSTIPKSQVNSLPEPESEPDQIRKQPDSSPTSTSASLTMAPPLQGIRNLPSDPYPPRFYGLSGDSDRKVLHIPGSFRKLQLAAIVQYWGQFGNFLDGLNPNGSDVKTLQMCNPDGRVDPKTGSDKDPGLEEYYLDSNCWSGGGWPDLAIYTPASTF